ncbi:MAG: hypothetical protein V4681_02810 [Patescibacteria group bacterium]
MNTTLASRADLVRQASDCVAARTRATRYHELAAQRRFELAIDAEVRTSIAAIYQERCAEAITEAVTANQRLVLIDIPTYYGDAEPAYREYWWKAGVRCKAIVRHLSAYLRHEGFTVLEGEQYYTRTYRGAKRGNIGLHAIPLTILW